MGALAMRFDDNTEVYYSEIHAALDEYIQDAQAEDEAFDMRKAPQSRWNAALIYIYTSVFKGTNKLKQKPYDSNNLVNGGMSNNNAYDLNIVNRICDYYITLCYDYDKEVSIMGFSKLTKIDCDAIIEWGGKSCGSGYKASPTGSEIYKKLSAEREESLANKLTSGKVNPVGILGILNHAYGWNMPGVSREQARRPALSAEELPKLGQSPPPEAASSYILQDKDGGQGGT